MAITLFCLVQGDDFRRSFIIDMQPTDTVAVMKEKIKDKKHSFKEAGIDAENLRLWQVSEW